MIRVFTESYFRTVYNYIFSLNFVIIVNFKRIQIIRKERGLSANIEQVFASKMLEVLDETKNYLLNKKIGKMTKKMGTVFLCMMTSK